MNKKFGFALVGAGMAALPHARALQALSDRISVKGVFARTLEKRKSFADKFGFPVAESVEALAENPDVDALLLITPPNARLELIERFAAKGKHILCEKPLERTAAAAKQITDICAQAQVELGIVFQHRFREASQKLKALLKANALGKIHLVRIEVPWWRGQAYYDEPGRGTLARDGGGVLISQAIHTLDLMLSLTGPVSSVQALAATSGFHKMECEDFVAGGMEFESGAAGSIMATTAAFPGGAESIRLDGDKASALLKEGTLTLWRQDGGSETFGAKAAGTGGGADPMAFPFDWHRDLIASFVERVRGGERPLVSGEDALAVQRLIAAFLESSAKGRRVALKELS